MKNSSDQTSFGFKKVPKDQKSKLVKEVFDQVASTYDLMNDAMSLGVHRAWKQEFISSVINNGLNQCTEGDSLLLDVGGGTGDIGFGILKKRPLNTKVTLVDINHSMLRKGREKSFDNATYDKTHWLVSDVEKLAVVDNCFHACTASFCLRNITDLSQGLTEIYRVLKPGGRFFCLEFSHINNKLVKSLYKPWLFGVVPKIGKFIAKNESAYQYLAESIQRFPDAASFSKIIEQAGFSSVYYKSLSFGIAAIHIATKI